MYKRFKSILEDIDRLSLNEITSELADSSCDYSFIHAVVNQINNNCKKYTVKDVFVGVLFSLFCEQSYAYLDGLLRYMDNYFAQEAYKMDLDDIYTSFISELIRRDKLSPELLLYIASQNGFDKLKRKIIHYTYLAIDNINEKEFTSYKQAIVDYLEIEKDDTNWIGLFHLIVKSKLATADLFKIYCDKIYSYTNNEQYRYYFSLFEIPWLVLHKTELIYPDYYDDRYKFLEQYTQYLNVNCLPPSRNNTKKVALLVSGLAGRNFASARLEISVANEFEHMGYEVVIVVADCNYRTSDFAEFFNPYGTRDNHSNSNGTDHFYMKNEGVNIVYNEGKDYIATLNNFVSNIENFGPDFVVDFTDEFLGVIGFILRDKIPVVHVSLQGVNSSSFYDINIVRDKSICGHGKGTNDIQIEKNVYIPYLVEKRSDYVKGLCVTKDDYVIVTAGNRLEYEMDEEFLKKIASILNKYEWVKWVVVGAWINKYDFLVPYIENKRIINMCYQDYLPDTYHKCDIFLNPSRCGGGGGIASFIQIHKPALVLDRLSDIRPFIGCNNCSGTNYEELFECLERFILQPDLGKDLAERQYNSLMSDEFSVESYVRTIIESVDKQMGGFR